MVHAERATVWDTPQSMADLRARIGGFDLWIGTRMHSCIFATTSGVPTIAIGYEPKVAGYFDLLGLPDLVLNIESVTADQIALLAGRAWRERDILRARLAARLPEVHANALVSARVAAELMAGRLDRNQQPDMDRDGPPARGV
jgi:colanic acid/amylovoran biosynthesis protein